MEEKETKQLKFPTIHPLKIALLSICTFGIYELYWFWMNWMIVKQHEKSKIMPIFRALFSVIYCFPLFDRITNLYKKKKIVFSSIQLAVFYIVISLLGFLPEPYLLLGFASFWPIMEAQNIINEINKKDPSEKLELTFTTLEKLVIGIGGAILILAIMDMLFG